MKIKAEITIPENNSLENERGVFTITYESEIEIDDEEIDKLLVDRLIKILKKEQETVDEVTRQFFVDSLFKITEKQNDNQG